MRKEVRLTLMEWAAISNRGVSKMREKVKLSSEAPPLARKGGGVGQTSQELKKLIPSLISLIDLPLLLSSLSMYKYMRQKNFGSNQNLRKKVVCVRVLPSIVSLSEFWIFYIRK